MNSIEIVKPVIGIFFLIGGTWLLVYTIDETKRGYRSRFGNDLKLYLGAIMGIILGIVLIYKTLF